MWQSLKKQNFMLYHLLPYQVVIIIECLFCCLASTDKWATPQPIFNVPYFARFLKYFKRPFQNNKAFIDTVLDASTPLFLCGKRIDISIFKNMEPQKYIERQEIIHLMWGFWIIGLV